MAILITGRLGSRDKKKHFIITLQVKSSRHNNPKHVHVSQESIKYIEQKLTEIKEEINRFIIKEG